MHREEDSQLGRCSDCGGALDPGRDRAYAYASNAFLCWDCAVRRGGSYDSGQERWATPPRTGDLPDVDSTPR
jgi:hypothetical protein